MIIDVVTERNANLHELLLDLFDRANGNGRPPSTYAVSYRTTKDNDHWELDVWSSTLSVGETLPTVPLWLSADFAVPLDLEKSYVETCKVLRIE